MSTRQTHLRTCHLCEAMCGLAIEVEGSRIVNIRGDREDPFSRGHLCPKGPALAALHDDPDRLRKPQLRTSAGWREIGWDEALDRAAEGLHRVQREHGKDALAVYLGNPTVHNHGAAIVGAPFLRALGTRHRYSATSIDQLPQMLVSMWMYGHQLLLPIPDLDRAEHLVIVGANPLVSNGSIMSAPDMRRRLRELQGRGGKVVVVDPRRSETAKLADEHVFIRPGTDALLLLAMLGVILDEGRERLGRLADLVEGVQRVRAAVEAFTPERAAEATGVEAETIRALARELADRRGVVYGRVGAATQEFGALTHWAIQLLNVFTGALDRPGGAMLPRPALDPLSLPKGVGLGPGSFGRWRSRVRGLPEFGGELPISTLAEDVFAGHAAAEDAAEDADEGRPALAPIRGLITLAGNPVLSSPRGSDVGRAIDALDFVVSIDIYRNETTSRADLILPPTSPLERSHFDLVFHLFAVRNTVKWSAPVFEPDADARHDWEILLGLWTRLANLRGRDRKTSGLGVDKKRALERGVLELLTRLGPDGVVDLGLRAGPHGRVLPRPLEGLGRAAAQLGRLELPGLDRLGQLGKGPLDLEELRRNPHGIDLGPLEPALPERLRVGRRRTIELAPEALLGDLGRLLRTYPEGGPSSRAPTPERPRFALIGRRLLRSNNSWMHNLPKLVAGKPACTLQMHPDDALALALRPGDPVRVDSRVGSLTAPLELSDAIMPGVVSLPHGFGHDHADSTLEVAAAHAGVSINELTDPEAIDVLSGVAAFSGVPVEVRLAEGASS
ncbi:Anaerobic dehydrogenase, typically selenocysteine-containing [Plesiocystis pacifica SIR-1]|uniref:Anaerobic dehydrogenase, typically selenocysteine-containing n=1 Tax=Plesiocystis pacifica SIR-1 TaxID=391625 RepID=A6G094_9BACT|nr:molybdopterin-dependent oxidoreductase [Plesiocystis pacifica]EDM80791.1 Anaerobic dehydrogenase, typically selenocysteine-containing [Plesiocystis pacifica SIR-1]